MVTNQKNPFQAPAENPETTEKWDRLGADLRRLGEGLLFAVPVGMAPVLTFFCVGSWVEAHTHYMSVASFAAAIWAGGAVLAVVLTIELGAHFWRRRHDDL